MYVLPCSDPASRRSTRSSAELAVEIDGAQFALYPVSVSAALWCSAARSPAGVLLSLTRGPAGAPHAREPGTRVPFGHSSPLSSREIDPFLRGDTGNASMRGRSGPADDIHRGYHPTSGEREQQGNKRPARMRHECSGEQTARARAWPRWRS